MKMLAAQVLDRLQFASVSRKLSIGFGVVVLFSALIVTGTWLAGSLTIANAHSLVYEQAPIERAVRNWQTSSVKMSEIALRSTLTRGGGDVFNLSLQVHGLMKEEDSLLESITSMADASDYRAQILPVLQSAKQQRGKYIAFRADIIQKALEEKIITQRDLRDHETEMRLYLGAINNVLSLAEKISKESAEKMMLSARGVQAFSAFSFFIIILLSATSIWILRKSIVDRLAEVSRVAMDIARGGDLGHRIPDVPACGDEIVTMANSFNAMVEQVESGARVIRKKSNDMAAMLKTMPQGLLTIDANNVVQPEYSAHLAAILETDEIAGRSVMGLVFADTTLSSDTLSQVEAIAGACVGEDAMNFTFNRHLLVPEVEKVMPDGRTKVLELTWSAIVNEEDVTEQILLCIRDVTELRQLSQEAAAQKRELEIIGQVLAVPVEKFEAVMASAHEHLERTEEIVRVSAGEPEAVNEAFKHLHTIKGNARTYALKHLASVVHDAEQVYADLRAGDAERAWDRQGLLSDLAELRSEIALHEHVSREKLGRKADGARKAMLVPEAELRALLDKLQRASESQSIDVLRSVVHQAHRVLRMLKAQPMSVVVEDIVKGLSDLAGELGKPAPSVQVEDGGVALEEVAASALSDAFVHVLRNALDHGIESPEERQAAGKPQAGRIEIMTRVDEDWVTVTVRDDGRGLALDRIRAAAQAKGLVANAAILDDQAAANLIFAAGFSTAERVTMVSGRGVGMDAVRSAVRALGGDVSIRLEDDHQGAAYRQFSMLVKVPAGYLFVIANSKDQALSVDS